MLGAAVLVTVSVVVVYLQLLSAFVAAVAIAAGTADVAVAKSL